MFFARTASSIDASAANQHPATLGRGLGVRVRDDEVERLLANMKSKSPIIAKRIRVRPSLSTFPATGSR